MARRSVEPGENETPIPHIPEDIPVPDTLGAPAALRRLQLAELEAYRAHKAALASGDLLAASEAESSWIRIASQMRHYEQQVKQAD
jgi:hypothetical protein